MGLGFGLLSAQLRPGETDWTRVYDETVGIAVEAERLGFDSVWTTEHHFVDDGYMPSLLVVSAALAAVTSRIEIGTGVVLAPLHDPLRLAEDAATVALLSHNRLTLGVGLGWVQAEFDGFGADMHRRGKAMDEILSILEHAWSGKVFGHDGEIYGFPELAVRPTPSEPIPVVIGAHKERPVRRAARSAAGLFTGGSFDDLVVQTQWARDELERAGRDPEAFRVIHYTAILPADSFEEAVDRYAAHVWHSEWKYDDMEPSVTRTGAPPPAPGLENAEEMMRDAAVAGSPDEIVSRLRDIRARTALPVEFVARSWFPTLIHDQQIELMERIAQEVAPHI
jgi:probable F420-dependent oxidoreductase